MQEMRIFGPPGTGKTTKLSKEIIPKLAFMYGSQRIMITSFTRAAAEELASRLDEYNPEIVGTLHSICYRALNFPPLTEKYITEWNKEYPSLQIDPAMKKEGAQRMSRYQTHRNRMIPRNAWPGDVKSFADRWEEWKNKNGYMDFMDLIETAGGLFSPPGNTAAIVVDEAQDFARLEMSIIRRWGTQVKELWVVGDDDQTLYSFTGASPVNMLEPPLPPEQKIILNQSYRIPAAVHRLAEKIIRRVKNREEKQYLPKKEEGEVHFCSESVLDVEWIVKKAISLPGKTMILASCNYMLHGIIAELKEHGIPFANPWKPEEKSWNPISNKTSQLFIDFISQGEDSPYWNTEQFISFAQHLKVGKTGLIRKQGNVGLKQLIALVKDAPDTPGLHTCREYIGQILTQEAIDCAIKRDCAWLLDNIASVKTAPLRYPIKVFEKHGKAALEKEPDIFVGTIHSVKGAGSENVIICPDISYSGMMEALHKEGYENLCRLFYVGITRTKEKLFILSPSDRNFFDFN